MLGGLAKSNKDILVNCQFIRWGRLSMMLVAAGGLSNELGLRQFVPQAGALLRRVGVLVSECVAKLPVSGRTSLASASWPQSEG